MLNGRFGANSMGFLRPAALLILLAGVGLLLMNISRRVNSGEIMGIYPLTTRQVQTPHDFLVMLRKSGGLLIGKEDQRKPISTDLFSFPVEVGNVEIRLVITKKSSFGYGHKDGLFNPSFILIDEKGMEVFQKKVHGLYVAMSAIRAGFNSEFIYFVGIFRPEVSRKYRLVVSLDERVYGALNTTIEVEVRRNTQQYDYRQILSCVAMIWIGAILLFLTRPNRISVKPEIAGRHS